MTAEQEAGEGGGSIAWTEIETLKGTRFGALVADLEEIIREKRDLEEREKAIRDLIEPFVQNLPYSVRAGYSSMKWYPPGQRESLDRALLVKAGVTPDQIQAGLKKSPRKGYLEVRPAKGDPIPASGVSS